MFYLYSRGGGAAKVRSPSGDQDLKRTLPTELTVGEPENITLLYKGGGKEHIKKWRLISLLNVDLKILAKCLANRLKKCIGKIVNSVSMSM